MAITFNKTNTKKDFVYIKELKFLGIDDNQLKFKVNFNGHWFDYFQGVGHLKELKYNSDKITDHRIIVNSEELKNIPPKAQMLVRRLQGKLKSYMSLNLCTIFSELDFLHCIKLDAECGSYSFDEFCDNLGCNNDSINDFNTYRTCMETASKVRGFKWPKELEDY